MATFSRMSLLVMGLLALAASGCAQKDQKSCSSLLNGVTLPDSQVKAFKSSNTGRNYDIYIRFPDEFAQNKGKKYPVLYVLDGQWDFKLLDSIYGGLLYDGFVPEMIIVGITYSGPNPDYNALRAMDYTPVKDPTLSGSGGASKFLAFLKSELIPFIETNYPADPSRRVLMGSSFGGLFTLYAMFVEPELFSGYVSASPAVTYGLRYAFTQEAQYAKTRHDLPARLYLSVGELEDLQQPVEKFMQTIKDRGYTGFEMETQTVKGERHSGNKPEAFNRGLRYIFHGAS